MWKAEDEFIVEWRALTVALLDRTAVLVRERLGMDAINLPLAKVLEGGTWAVGSPDRQGQARGRRAAARDRERRHGVLSEIRRISP